MQEGWRAECSLEGCGFLCCWLRQECSWSLGKSLGTRLQVKPEERHTQNININDLNTRRKSRDCKDCIKSRMTAIDYSLNYKKKIIL